MNCINLSQFIAYQNGKLTPVEHKKIKEHIEVCSVCQKNVEEYIRFLSLFKKSYQRYQSRDVSQCYEDTDLLNFIEGKSSQKSRATFYSHILECQSCMDRTLSLQRVFNELRQGDVLISHERLWDKTRRFISDTGVTLIEKLQPLWTAPKILRPAYAWVGLILLLCISMIAIINIDTSNETQIITRDNQFDVAHREVQLIHPANKSELNIHKTEFQWSAPKKTVAYKFFLLDARGNILWETRTKNKRLILPDSIRLDNNHLYFWRVEALFDDGTSMPSPMISFTNVLE